MSFVRLKGKRDFFIDNARLWILRLKTKKEMRRFWVCEM